MAYWLMSTGVLLEIHHCMGRVANTDIHLLAVETDTHCGRCGMEKGGEGKHCCKDEFKQVKISDDHQAAQLHVQPSITPVALPAQLFAQVEVPQPITLAFPAWQAKPPPDELHTELSFLGVFRI